MPHVNVHITDNTGIEVTSQESVVFIPGGIKPKKTVDANNCIYISSSQLSSITDILTSVSKAGGVTDVGTAALVESCLSAGLDVIYCYVEGYGMSKLLPDLDFLKDKDTYNVKFLTTGYFGGIIISSGSADLKLSDSIGEEKYTFILSDTYKKLADLAQSRTDCTVLAHTYYYKSTDVSRDDTTGKCTLDPLDSLGSGDILATQVSNKLTSYFTADEGSYTYLLVPNVITTFNIRLVDASTEVVLPGFYTYLVKYGQALANGQEWLPLANSERGSAVALGTPDLTVTKYVLDNYTLKDPLYGDDEFSKSGVSVNGIVELRPYGNVIWGDRTCRLVDDKGVKATTYQSLRMLLCDVSKRAYQAAVRYTYESNNDVTWLNFKSRVTELLGEMVAAGVLSGFDMRKQPSNALNTIVCKITLYPNLPVENFDIYINLENAEISTESGAEG